MELSWLILFLSFSLCLALKSLFDLLSHSKAKQKKLFLPPGPFTVPIIGNLLWVHKSPFHIEPILHSLRHKYGPIITLHFGRCRFILVTTHSLAHQALIQNGAIFSDRAPATLTSCIMNNNKHTITSADYGPLWRILRRNLTSEILHPSRAKSYAHARKWILQLLTQLLKDHVESGEPVQVIDHFQYAMFCLLVFMCFGEKLDDELIRKIEYTQRTLLINFSKFDVIGSYPILGRLFLRRSWQQLLDMRDKRDSVIVPIIRSRQQRKEKKQEKPDEFIVSYLDTLFDLQIPDDGGRNLTEQEMAGLCSEFLDAGTDTTSTTFQWIMANLVKHQEIQEKLYFEIKGVVGSEEIKEEDLQKMPYLKAVVLEGLRLHPPAHFVLPHAVTEDTVFNGHAIPKKSIVDFTVADMGRDPMVWKDPMQFKPERFLSNEGEAFDITGTKGIKMMPFGVGRRICPAIWLALLHLEYFVSSLVKDFKWTAVDGNGVDLSEKLEFTVVMKNPLRAHISPRVA